MEIKRKNKLQTIYSLLILSISLNIGVGMMAEGFGFDIPTAIDLQEFANTNEDIAQDLATDTTNPFNTILIFGNFIKVAQVFVNAISGQWLLGTINMLGIQFPPVMIYGLSALYFAGAVWGLIYLIGGRGTKGSD